MGLDSCSSTIMRFGPCVSFPVALMLSAISCRAADACSIRIDPPPPIPEETFHMGATTAPSGSTIGLNARSLLRDGKPWVPVMGEFHYSRYPEAEWREELLKMKAGGIDIVATYVFWIHHEEIEGRWDWSGDRNLRRFLELCRETGMLAAVRCGPWCHGEVRNGGLPDWLLSKGFKVRSDDSAYLERVKELYAQIGEQLKGLLWKDGGPVVAVQVENEYSGPAEHLLTLKKMARDAGLDVPLYTRTGWPALRTPMPFGELAPLFGAYAEGFWDRVLTSMPGRYWAAFQFLPVRTDAAIATEQLGEREARDEADAARYPYLTCELGGGMISSYHRRIRIDPADIDTVSLVKIGSGGNMPGYYMYHGGTNPTGRQTTLMEAQDTPITNWNDMPTKSYDFYAPIGGYGQLRPQYHSLRRLHLWARDFGGELATMTPTFPSVRPAGPQDTTTLRWAVRSNGDAGYVFVSNHQRGLALTEKENVRFSMDFPDHGAPLPSHPVIVPGDARFIWPFNLDLGYGIRLRHATAQLICKVEDGPVRWIFFSETPGTSAEFFVAGGELKENGGATVDSLKNGVVLGKMPPGHTEAFRLKGRGGEVRVVLLSDADSLALWKGDWLGRERVILSSDGVVFDGDKLRVTSANGSAVRFGVFPAVDGVIANGGVIATTAHDGIFQTIELAMPSEPQRKATVQSIKPAGPAREIPLGKSPSPVAAAPKDADFEAAGVWVVKLPEGAVNGRRTILRLSYRGDVARVKIGDTLITDDFYNGRPLEIGLWRHAETLAASRELRVEILPLRRDAPIFMPADAWPNNADGAPVAELAKAELVPYSTVEFTAEAPKAANPATR